MKQVLLFLFLLFLGFTSSVHSQFITVDDSMSVQELVEDVLISVSPSGLHLFLGHPSIFKIDNIPVGLDEGDLEGEEATRPGDDGQVAR